MFYPCFTRFLRVSTKVDQLVAAKAAWKHFLVRICCFVSWSTWVKVKTLLRKFCFYVEKLCTLFMNCTFSLTGHSLVFESLLYVEHFPTTKQCTRNSFLIFSVIEWKFVVINYLLNKRADQQHCLHVIRTQWPAVEITVFLEISKSHNWMNIT